MRAQRTRRRGVGMVAVVAGLAVSAGAIYLFGTALDRIAAPPVADQTLTCPADTVAGGETVAARPCKPCKGREWCECYYTYQGRRVPRISCDPCCYWDYGLPYPICLD